MRVDIWVHEDRGVYVEVERGKMLCIGTKTEVDAADSMMIAEMIYSALQINRYQGIEHSHFTIH